MSHSLIELDCKKYRNIYIIHMYRRNLIAREEQYSIWNVYVYKVKRENMNAKEKKKEERNGNDHFTRY